MNQNQNQRYQCLMALPGYEVLMHFTGYNAREGITGGEYAANLLDCAYYGRKLKVYATKRYGL